MPDRLRPALGLAVGLAAVSLSGCANTGSRTATAHRNVPASSAATPPSRAEFIAHAEAVCHTLSAQEQPLKTRQESLKGLQTVASERAFVSLARQVVTFSQTADSKLQVLPRPTADAGAIEALLRSFSHEVADASELAKAAANQESTIGEDAEQALRRSIAQTSSLAAAYGMKDCIGEE